MSGAQRNAFELLRTIEVDGTKEEERDRWVLMSVGDIKCAAFGWRNWERVHEQRTERFMGLSSMHVPFTLRGIRTQRIPPRVLCAELEV